MLLGLATVLLSFLLPPAALPVAARPSPPGAPYAWVYDAGDASVVPRIKALGLNTVFVNLPVELTAQDLQAARDVVTAAAAQGLQVIIGLPTTMPQKCRVTPDDSIYVQTVTAYVREVVPRFRDAAPVIGFATGDYLEKHLVLSDEGFRRYLQAKYGSLARVNEVWHSRYSVFDAVTREEPTKLCAKLPFAAGQPSFDLADYEGGQYRDVMAFWARLVREASGGKGLLFTGRVTLYRSLPLIPDDYDVIVTSMPPELLERDWATHNVQAVDIARRGGRRDVLPCLRIPNPLANEDVFFQNRLHEWMMEAALHGACGFSFEAEPEVLGERRIQAQLQAGLAWMAGQPALRSHPRGAAAILYEPYADGFEALGVPVYGYVKGLSLREPSDLCNDFKRGTRYGLVEYLARDDVPTADLDRYGVILAPMAVDLPDPVVDRLCDYVLHGGVLVADLGAGCLQTGSWQALPPRLAQLFGVPSLVEMKALAGNLTIQQPCAALPSLPSGARTSGDAGNAAGGSQVGAASYAVSGWAGFALADPQTILFGRLAMGLTSGKKPTFAGIVAREWGTGAALYSTARLWSNWMPNHRLFAEFHSDLWQRRANIEVVGDSFVAPSLEVAENEDDSLCLYNRGRLRRVQLALYGAKHRLFAGAVCQFSAVLTDETGLRTGGVLATLDAPQHASCELTPMAVEVRPYVGVATALLEADGPEGLRLTIAGGGSQPQGPLGELSPSKGSPQRVRIRVGSGAYPVAPGSRHHLTVTNADGSTEERALVADGQGRLAADLTVDRSAVTVQPEREEPTGGR